MGIGRDLLFEAAAPLVGDFPGSPEGLIDSLARCPSQLVPISEMGRFLASAQRGYFEPIKALMADLWDAHCHPAHSGQQPGDPRGQPEAFRRGCLLHPLPGEVHACRRLDRRLHGPLVCHVWTTRADEPRPGRRSNRLRPPCRGASPSCDHQQRRVVFGPDSSSQADVAQVVHRQSATARLPSQITGVRSRAPTMARKAALLYAWDWGKPASGQPWQMDVEELYYGIQFAELHIQSVSSVEQSYRRTSRCSPCDVAFWKRSKSTGAAPTWGPFFASFGCAENPSQKHWTGWSKNSLFAACLTDGEYVYVLREKPSDDSFRHGY